MRIAIVIAGLILLSSFAQGATLTVPTLYPTIQQAIDAAADGDVVLVHIGTYNEKIDFLGKAITVRSDGDTLEWTIDLVPTTTIIDGAGAAGYVVTFANDEAAESNLLGFTIRNGHGDKYYSGGGILCSNASPTISNNIITGNSSKSNGGGLMSDGGTPAVVNNIINDNQADNNGGGVYLAVCSDMDFKQNTVVLNKALAGCGGGIYLEDVAGNFLNNVIRANESADGAGFYASNTDSADMLIKNNLIVENIASNTAGGMYINDLTQSSLISILNCTVAYNEVTPGSAAGRGIRFADETSASIRYSIIWDDLSDPLIIQGTPQVEYCDVKGGWLTDNNNLNVDPLFWQSELGDYFLCQVGAGPGQSETSACVDYADIQLNSGSILKATGANPPEHKSFKNKSASPDIFSLEPYAKPGVQPYRTTRTDGAIDTDNMDIGYHFPVYYVPDDYASIQEAIAFAPDGMQVIVRAGTYYENIVFSSNKSIKVRSEEGPEATVIDGGVVHEPPTCPPEWGSVVIFMTYVGRDTVLDGFTITNGRGYYKLVDKDVHRYVGGGIYCQDCSPTIINNVIEENDIYTGYSDDGWGGGIYCVGGNTPQTVWPLIQKNTIRLNKAHVGGGIYSNGASPEIVGNDISSNNAGGGCGVYAKGLPIILLDNQIMYNSPHHFGSGNGAGIYLTYSGIHLLANNAIVSNKTCSLGGGVYCYAAAMHLVNNTIAYNRAASKGGGICIENEGHHIKIDNTVVWGNVCSQGYSMDLATIGTGGYKVEINYSDIDGGLENIGGDKYHVVEYANNIDADPIFAGFDDVHLQISSPCKDAGNNDAPNLPEYDFEGDPRIVFNNVDMGADEVTGCSRRRLD